MLELLRRRLSAEEGMTLAELLVSMTIFAIIVPIFLSVLTGVQRGFERQADRSGSNDQARLAAQQLDKEIRSGNLLYDPASETPANMTLRIYTQTNATTRSPGNRCVQWRILDGQLQRRDWAIDWRSSGVVSSWRIVADHVVNQTLGVPAFQLDPDPAKGYQCARFDPMNPSRCLQYVGRALVVTIVTQQDARSGNPVRIRQTITGRNTQFGYPVSVCDDAPPA